MNIYLVNNVIWNPNGNQIGGVEYHRMMKPHYALSKVFPEVYPVDEQGRVKNFMMSDGIGEAAEEAVDQTDLVIFSRYIPEGSAEYLNKKGVPFGLDLDDYWHLPEHHIAYEDYLNENKAEKTIRSIKDAHFVICTTEILAEKIKEFNPNVYVIPNGIDTTDPAWQPNKKESNRLRFGFTGGNTHHIDIGMIAPSVRKSLYDVKFCSHAQVLLAGYKPSPQRFDENGKRIQEIGVEQYIENILTDNLQVLNKYSKYKTELLNSESEQTNAPYRRKGIIPVNEFGFIYDEIDVCVAPLLDNEFNNCKSELKMLEAGFKDCAIMLHHVKPYTIIATDKNSFDLNKKTFFEWARYLIKNPNLVADSKAQLRLDIEKYELKHLSETRHKIYLKYGKKKI
jgi:hypothetical protein